MSSMSNTPGWTVARLLPVNNDAQSAFDWLVRHESLSRNQQIHLQATALANVEDFYDSNPAVNARLADPDNDLKKMWTGHFQLTFSNLRSGQSLLGWRMGRGSDTAQASDRNVDILVTPPGKHSGGVVPLHSFIHFHPVSGCLMLMGVNKIHPVRYELNNETLELRDGDKHVLYQQTNRFSLGTLDFKLVFENQTPADFAMFVGFRNDHLRRFQLRLPHPRISAIPRKNHAMVAGVVVHDILNFGSFGVVSAAVDAKTGEQMAMKDMLIKTEDVKDSFDRELNFSTRFKVS